MPKSKDEDTKSDEEKGNKDKKKKKTRQQSSSSSSGSSGSSENDEPLEEEVITIKHGYIGPIIGQLGSKIQSLRAKTGAMISVIDGQKVGMKKSKVVIKGRKGLLQAACYEINKILKEKPSRPKPFGSSPQPKKPKSNN